MKTRFFWLLSTLIVLCLIGGAVVGRRIGQVAKPTVKHAPVGFDPPTLDLGASPWNSDMQFKARFANHGDAPLVICEIQSSCGCLTVGEDYIGRTIAPGAGLDFAGTIDTEYKPGKAERTLDVRCAGGEEFRLTLSLEVEATWGMTPETLVFDEFAIADASLRVNGDVNVLSVAADAPWLTARIVGDGIEVALDWELVRAGRQAAVINVYTDDPHVPGLRVPVSILSSRTTCLHPSVIYLHDSSPRVLALRGGAPARVIGIQALPDGIEAAIEESKIEFTRQSEEQGLEATAYVDLSNGEQLSILLYY